ncbi:hypothetical protein F4810DRAFT_681869 [Camillea tinctor]|nr:hypothetical protein F4810DRAFT_681869 [Camillea tinctor]
MTAAYGFIKLSVIYSYRRIFIISKGDLLNPITNLCSVVVTAWTIAYILAIAFDCDTTFQAHWGSISDLFTYCHGGYPVQRIYESLLISDLITDVIILALPMPRVSFIDPTLDENQSVSTVMYWFMVEAGLSLIVACLPTIQNLFRGQSLGSVVASVRSAISLTSFTGRSRGSAQSRGSQSRSNAQRYEENRNISSAKRLADLEDLA